ncbi:unnamed protein product, partial [Closterium sp. Naga37s-1]
ARHLQRAAPSIILSVKGRMVLDARGEPTVEAEVGSHRGKFRASVPTGVTSGIVSFSHLLLHPLETLTPSPSPPPPLLPPLRPSLLSFRRFGPPPLLLSFAPPSSPSLPPPLLRSPLLSFATLFPTLLQGQLGANVVLAASVAVELGANAILAVPLSHTDSFHPLIPPPTHSPRSPPLHPSPPASSASWVQMLFYSRRDSSLSHDPHSSLFPHATLFVPPFRQGELGANAILAVSLAVCRAGAAERELPLHEYIASLAAVPHPSLPVPEFALLSGALTPPSAASPPFHSLSILPLGASTFAEAVRIGAEVQHCLQALAAERFGSPTAALVTDDSSLGLPLTSPQFCNFPPSPHPLPPHFSLAPLSVSPFSPIPPLLPYSLPEYRRVVAAADVSLSPLSSNSYPHPFVRSRRWTSLFRSTSPSPLPSSPSRLPATHPHSSSPAQPAYGMDAPAASPSLHAHSPIFPSHHTDEGHYDLGMQQQDLDGSVDISMTSASSSSLEQVTVQQLIDVYQQLCSEFPIVSIEDPFDQEDIDATQALSEAGFTQVVGNDLLVSNAKRLAQAIERRTCSGIAIK